MPSDRAKIDSTKKSLRRQFLGPVIAAGPIVAGKYYILTKFVSGDDFQNVIDSSNLCGPTKGVADLLFLSTGTAPTTWTHGSKLNEWKLDELKALASQAFTSAKTTVTLNDTSFEGGGQRGEITFDRSLLLIACEELIEETDPGYVMPVARGGRPIGITVQVGGC